MTALYWTLLCSGLLFLGMVLGAIWERLDYMGSARPVRFPMGMLFIILVITITVLFVQSR